MAPPPAHTSRAGDFRGHSQAVAVRTFVEGLFVLSFRSMIIRREQMDVLAEHYARARICEMAERIRADFRKELAGVNHDDFHSQVERLVRKMRGYGFS